MFLLITKTINILNRSVILLELQYNCKFTVITFLWKAIKINLFAKRCNTSISHLEKGPLVVS